MTTGISLQAQAPAAPGADLGFWLGAQIIGQPMAMAEDHLGQLIQAISANRFTLPRNRKTGARITPKGTAIVEVHGILIDRAPILGTFWGLTAYEGLAEQFARLETHDDVKRIVLDVNSPGGLVRGIEGAARALERLAAKKPVHAIAHNQMCSAAYWIGAVAEAISCAPGADLGSIGVRSGHVSYAEQLDRAGIRVTIFGAGAAKTDGNPYSLLSDGEYAEKTYEMERINDTFVAHVAKHRPMSEQHVRDLAARSFAGADAVAAKLADRIESLDDMIARLERTATPLPAKKKAATEPGSRAGRAPPERLPTSPDEDEPAAGPHNPRGAKLMDEQTQPAEASDLAAQIASALTAIRARDAAAQATASPAQAAPTPAAQPAAQDSGAAAADVTAVAAALQRVFTILESAEGVANPKMAIQLAKAGLQPDAAKAILTAAGPATSAAKSEADALGNALERRMSQAGNAAGVKPEGAPAAALSLAEKMKARGAKR